LSNNRQESARGIPGAKQKDGGEFPQCGRGFVPGRVRGFRGTPGDVARKPDAPGAECQQACPVIEVGYDSGKSLERYEPEEIRRNPALRTENELPGGVYVYARRGRSIGTRRGRRAWGANCPGQGGYKQQACADWRAAV